MKMIKKFKDKRIIIWSLRQSDIKKALSFKKFINELAEDDTAYITMKTKITLKQEREYIKQKLKKIRKHQIVMLIAKDNNKIIGQTSVSLMSRIQNHIGGLGISVLKNYRGMGLGKYLTKEILRLARSELRPKPKIIKLGVFSVNKIAISLYKKMGFKPVAKIPEQFNFKGKLLDEIIMLRKL